MTKRALVTGATGFIGLNLVTRLVQDGWSVHALLRTRSESKDLPSGLTVHRFDGVLEDLIRILKSVKPDVVFHLASLYLVEHRPDQIDELIASNITLPTQLAQAMTEAGCLRLVNTGTAWQHFQTDGFGPVNLYAATKQACLDMLRFFHEARGLSVVTLKLFDTYGAGDKRRKLVQLLVDAAMSGEPLGMSPGEQIVDMTHVDDVAGAFVVAADRLLAADAPMDERLFVSGERLSVRQLADAVADALGRPIHAEFGARPYRTREVMLPISPDADRIPNWQPRWRLRDAIAQLVVS